VRQCSPATELCGSVCRDCQLSMGAMVTLTSSGRAVYGAEVTIASAPRTRVVGSVTSVDPSRRGNKRTRRAATARRCCPASSAGPIICSSRSTASATTPPQPSNGSAGNWRSHTTRCEPQAWRPSCRRWRRYVTTAKPPSRRNSADRVPRPAIEPAENLVMVASDML
jgi:hypothetical protein